MVKFNRQLQVCGGVNQTYGEATYVTLAEFDFQAQKNKAFANGKTIEDWLLLNNLIDFLPTGCEIKPAYIVSMGEYFNTADATLMTIAS